MTLFACVWVQSMTLPTPTRHCTCKWGRVAMTAMSNLKWCPRSQQRLSWEGNNLQLGVVTLLNWTHSYLNGITYGKAFSKDWTTQWNVLRWDWSICMLNNLRFHSRSTSNTKIKKNLSSSLWSFINFASHFLISKLETTICKSRNGW
jgi:hypothetical protein